MLKKIALVFAVVVVALLAYAATRPDSLHVQRSAVINAPPDRMIGSDLETGLASLKAIAESRDPAGHDRP